MLKNSVRYRVQFIGPDGFVCRLPAIYASVRKAQKRAVQKCQPGNLAALILSECPGGFSAVVWAFGVRGVTRRD